MKYEKPVSHRSALGFFLAGCATTEGITNDPPPLELQSGSVTPRVTYVTVKNGAGELLFEGQPDDKGLISANPDRSKLDGTLVITSRWNDQITEETQTLRHEPGKPVKISPHNGVPRTFKVEVQETQRVARRRSRGGLITGSRNRRGISIGRGGA